MKVVILAGGQGTRLREETEYRPKPLVEVGGRPILWHIMKCYAHYGYNEFAVCLGYRGNAIKEYFLNYEAMNNDFTIALGQVDGIVCHDGHDEQDFRITLADTGMETMTGGRVARIAKYIDTDTFMVSYGDGVSDVDIGALVAFHRSHGKMATVTTVQPTSRFGHLKLGTDDRVEAFSEKPKLDTWTSAGFFVFNREILDHLDGDDCVLEQQPLKRIASEGQLIAYRHPGFFFAMDTYREYLYLNELWDANEAPWKVWE